MGAEERGLEPLAGDPGRADAVCRGWMRFNRRLYPFNAFRSLLGITSNTTVPTYAELYSGDWAHATSSGCMC